MREFLERGLRKAGYTVVSVDSVNDAVLRLASGREHFSLIISDAMLPDTTSPQFIRQIRQQGSATRVVFMSGYTSDTSLLEEAVKSGDGFLQKPFSIRTLLRKTVCWGCAGVGPVHLFG